MSGLVDNHPLGRDLPEYKQEIHDLKMHDAHFARRMEEYEALDKEIVRAEQGVENMSDQELDTKKMERVHMKDELYQMLEKAHNKNG